MSKQRKKHFRRELFVCSLKDWERMPFIPQTLKAWGEPLHFRIFGDIHKGLKAAGGPDPLVN